MTPTETRSDDRRSEHNGDAVRVLVADDNEDHLFFIVRGLRELGGAKLEIDTVHDGAEALDFLHRRGAFADKPRPHLILLDLRMPKVGGLEVLAELKQDPHLRRIPVSVLTSSDAPKDVTAAYDMGTNVYLRKQPDMRRLRETLADATEFWTQTAMLPTPPE